MMPEFPAANGTQPQGPKIPMHPPQPMNAEYELNLLTGQDGTKLILMSVATIAGTNHIWFSQDAAKVLAQKLTALSSGIVLPS